MRRVEKVVWTIQSLEVRVSIVSYIVGPLCYIHSHSYLSRLGTGTPETLHKIRGIVLDVKLFGCKYQINCFIQTR